MAVHVAFSGVAPASVRCLASVSLAAQKLCRLAGFTPLGCRLQLSGAFVRLSEARQGITERILEMNGALEQVQSAQSLVQVRHPRARFHVCCSA